jgi:hypothetical protein
VGVETNRIESEFIIKSVIEKKIPAAIHIKRNKIDGLITDFILDKKIMISISSDPGKEFASGDEVCIYFSYFSHVMNFCANVLTVDEKGITVTYPPKIYKNLSRKYERVPAPENAKIVFSIKGEKFQLDFPKTEEYNSVDFPEFNTEEYAVDNIQQLITDFRTKILETVSFVNIMTYRKNKPETLEEQLISLSGKVLYIPSINKPLPEYIESVDVPVINSELADTLIPEAVKKLQTRNFDKSTKGIHSEIYCPVLYLEYVVGFIHVQNRDKNKSEISAEILEYIYQFSKVLAFSLKISGYFKEKVETTENYESTIIDISAAGFLFGSNSKKLEKLFFLYTDLKIDLYLGEKIIPLTCRIMRKYKSGDSVFYGLIILGIKQEDFENLFQLVYGRKVTDEDVELWEGGSAPPEIKF